MPDNYEGRDKLISQERKLSYLLVEWPEIDSTIFSLFKMQLGAGKGSRTHKLKAAVLMLYV